MDIEVKNLEGEEERWRGSPGVVVHGIHDGLGTSSSLGRRDAYGFGFRKIREGFENEISLVSNMSELIERNIGPGLLHILDNVIPIICV